MGEKKKGKIKSSDKILSIFLNEYQRSGLPIEVNFRQLFPHLNNADRATHLIHTYPAKLLGHIPYFFLNNSLLTKRGDNVFDPFCGSGTVLLEGLINGRNSYGSDANPLARLITQVKTFKYDVVKLKEYLRFLKNAKGQTHNKYPSVVNIDYWFLPRIKNELNKILQAINKIEEEEYQNFFLVCFSNCVKKVSLADPRVAVPVRIKQNHYPEDHPFRKRNIAILDELQHVNVKDKFLEIVIENINRITNTNNIINGNVSKIISDDARNIINPKSTGYSGLAKESVELIITSPPYVGAQKYIRSSSLNLGWTELAKVSELRELDKLSIGRENYYKNEYSNLIETGINKADLILEKIYQINPLRAHIAANYLVEMKDALKESYKVLKKGGSFIIVAANNHVCNTEFETQLYLQKIIEGFGAKIELRLIDDIKSYGLMTKRNKTANIITREWIIVFRKPN